MRETPASRIKQIMSEKNLKQVDILNLAKDRESDLGVTLAKGTLSQYVNGVQSPDQDRYYLLSVIFGVSEPWLMGYDVPKERVCDKERMLSNEVFSIIQKLDKPRKEKVYHFADRQLDEQNKTRTIEILGQAAAGSPIEYGDIIEEREVSHVPTGADVALVVSGDSMSPAFKDGSIVFYKRQPALENGEIGVFELNGGVTMKKFKMNGDVRLVSLNDDYEDIIVREGMSFKVLGKVIY